LLVRAGITFAFHHRRHFVAQAGDLLRPGDQLAVQRPAPYGN